ncbi:conserved hypothetical protein [Trichophyton verrucosum HKI 0517]|uniref:Uncharacterized protein n=1 Tax=Trichophyton verrucosum (strain HKI 0517) TaxID=663202 RepID=D4DAG0_TRIVH|nr:uncharacterized protein TRV_04107 [Trichophyton verrucosum HKI 0517]EFE41158.1 conserved hypothetical protein [Trichophyton verrucosum HKI 0517]
MDPLEFTPWHQLAPRGITGDVKDTFSSWDKCMAKSYCKWPAIVGIIVGGLILLSVVWCLVGCICCGYTCCKGCCECCSCCCPSSSSSRKPPPAPAYDSRSKFADDYSGYQRPAPPVYNTQAASSTPSYAQFDTLGSRPAPTVPTSTARVNDDALPNMPTWQDATTRRVEDTSHHNEEMEMSHLNPVTGHSVVDDPGAAHGSAYYQHAQPVSPIYPPDHHHTRHSQSMNMNMNMGGGYRGLDQGHISPSIPPTAIGIAHSPGCGPAPLSNMYHDSQQDQQTSGQIYAPPRYNTQSPSTIGIATPAPPGAGDAYGYTHPNGSSRSFTRSPVQHIRGTPSPRPQLSPILLSRSATKDIHALFTLDVNTTSSLERTGVGCRPATGGRAVGITATSSSKLVDGRKEARRELLERCIVYLLFYFFLFPPFYYLLPFGFFPSLRSCCDGSYYSFVDMFGYIPARIPVVVYILLLTFLFLLYRYVDELSTVYFSCFLPPFTWVTNLTGALGGLTFAGLIGCLDAYLLTSRSIS